MPAARWVSVLAPVVLWGQSSSGTTGVAIWTPDRAVVAIDSRVTLTAGHTSRRGPDTCKIQSTGRFLVAIAGLYDHYATKFSAWRLATEAVGAARSVAEAIVRAEQRILPDLHTAMENLQIGDRAAFARAHLAILITGMDDGVPAMAGRVFLPHENGAIQVVRWQSEPGTSSVFAFGETSAINQAYAEKKALADLIATHGAVDAARILVQLEIAHQPATVGPPISIVEMTAVGPTWIRSGLCAN